MHARPSGTALPWSAFALGAVGSLAANLWDAIGAAEIAGVTATADLAAALGFAAIVPVALLLVVEILIRSGKSDDGLDAVMWIGAAAVAAGAAVMSFGHMYKVMIGFGQPPLFAALMPLAVDGLMLVASVALARAGRAAHAADAPEMPSAGLPEPAGHAAEDAVSAAAVAEPVAVPAASETASVPEPVAVPAADVPENVPEDGKPADSGTEALPERADLDPRTAAQADAFDALREGRTITGKALAARYGKSERWGRDRIRAAKEELAALMLTPA